MRIAKTCTCELCRAVKLLELIVIKHDHGNNGVWQKEESLELKNEAAC